jgi:hypothetical protein
VRSTPNRLINVSTNSRIVTETCGLHLSGGTDAGVGKPTPY